MRQIITPLPKVQENRRDSTSPNSSARSSPSASPQVGELKTDIPVPRRHSVATASLLKKRGSPPLTHPRQRQLSHPLSATGQSLETPPNLDNAVDPSTFTSFSTSMSQNLSSSSPMSL